MSSLVLTRVKFLVRVFPAIMVLAGTVLLCAPSLAAEEFVTVRMRPQSMPFVTPTNRVVKRVVNLFLTVTRSARREVCAERAEIKSIFLVNTYNRQLADAKWRFDMKNLATDLYGALEPLFGKEKLVAVHLALGRTESSGGPENEVQKRLEQLEDCVTVRKLPQDAVTANFSDTKAGPVRSLATDADKAPRARSADRSSPSASETPDEPFKTHPQMMEQAKAENEPAQAKPAPPRRAGGDPSGCSLEIQDLWPPSWVTVDGVRYRFDLAVTLDADANGKVDDVSFVLRGGDDEELKTTYLTLHGRPGGAAIRGLTLVEPTRIFELCAGSHEFSLPGAKMREVEEAARPNLAAEVAQRIKGEEAAPPPEAEASNFWRWVAAVVSITAVILAAVVLLVFYLMMRNERRRKRDRRKKKRRKGDRRRRNAGPTGDERRAGNDRRGEDRRDDAPRRQKTDRRGTGGDEDED